jgi:Fic family protein
MLYNTPDLTAHRATLTELDAVRRRLGHEVSRATPWSGQLRRQARAATARSSTAIEGYHVTAEVASAVVEGRAAATDRDQRAVAGYALAMQHVAVLADDPSFGWCDRLLLDLHFEACASEPEGRPGLLRTGPVLVTGPGGGIAYRAPDADRVPNLMTTLVEWLSTGDLEAPVVVRAAMAHLHLVSIHPFRDGNGRLSRILQSLVLARDGVLSPELGSIEVVLARDTMRYYGALREVQGGSYQPDRCADPWIAFCIDAHLTQARERLATLERAAHRWATLEQFVEGRGWPDRLTIALEQSLFDGVDRASFCAEAAVSPATASADLRRLLDAGLVTRQGRGRDTRYLAAPALRAMISDAEDA